MIIPRALHRLEPWELAPTPGLFSHRSTLHGQAHVARVMVHAFRLLEATGLQIEASRLWAAVYLHDLARTHDGRCLRHGADAWVKLQRSPAVGERLRRAGVTDEDLETIETAVTHHCQPDELPRAHPHWRLTSLLKDADGLDRVRLGDLDANCLRHPASATMVNFASCLFEETDGRLPLGPGHFEALWSEALRIRDEGDEP